MRSVFFLGVGAVGGSLSLALSKAGYEIKGVHDPLQERGRKIADRLNTKAYDFPLPKGLLEAEIVIAAVPDSEITKLATHALKEKLVHPKACWFHVAGGVPAKALSPLADEVRSFGTFHPAHPFPPELITKIPAGTGFAFDGDEIGMQLAKEMATSLGGFVVNVPESSRAAYHASTVMVSNYVAALMKEAKTALTNEEIDGDEIERLLTSLAKAATARANEIGIEESLSGPILRGDLETVSKHLKALESSPDISEIYRVLGRATLRLAQQREGFDKSVTNQISRLLGNHEKLD